jgi:SAM-dependent methyltransferase
MEVEKVYVHKEILYWENMVLKRNFAHYRSEIEKRIVLKAHSLVTRPTTAFDIGCEGGRWANLLSDLSWRLICSDIDQRSLDICQKRIPTARCIRVSPEDTRLSSDTESIGLILCIGVEPVIHSSWFIDEAFRVLRGGGLLVGVFSNRSSWRGLLYRFIPSLRAGGIGLDILCLIQNGEKGSAKGASL